VVAIAAVCVITRTNAKAALVTRGLTEMVRIGKLGCYDGNVLRFVWARRSAGDLQHLESQLPSRYQLAQVKP